MPWEVAPVSELRLAFVHQVVSLHSSVSAACDTFHISRKTGYKWLKRYHELQDHHVLVDQSRRPHHSPRRTADELEGHVLKVRNLHHWGPRKIHAYLTAQGLVLPSARTVANILKRHGCISPHRKPDAATQFFERALPNQLWQCDHKGPLEIARQKIHPFTVLDDHSRFLLAARPCTELTVRTAFAILWDTFGEYGLPEEILCDNWFSTKFEIPKTISWFDSQLIRLGIRPIHGRPHHPQTQGKAERLHGTFERELWPFVRRDSLAHFVADLNNWRMNVYNSVRPHEALDDKPPLSRYAPSPRPRPSHVPPVEYAPGAVLRKVSSVGDVRWHRYRILAGRGLVGQWVRIEERNCEVALFYGWKQIRCLAATELHGKNLL